MKKLLPIFLASAAVLAHSAVGQNATTTPVGVVTITLDATTSPKATYIALPLTDSVTFAAPILSFTNNSITFSGTPFTPGGLTQLGAPFFLRVTSGAQVGRTILITGSNSASTIAVDVTDNSSQVTNLNASGFSLAQNDTVEIFPGDTLASLFGDKINVPLVLVEGTGPLNADTISIYNKTLGKLDVYYFKTALPAGNWVPASGVASNKNNVILYPESSIIVGRRGSVLNPRPALSLPIVGEVPKIALLTKTTGGLQAGYNSTRYPIDLRLSELNFSNWTRNDGVLNADRVSVFNSSTGRFDVYFQRLTGGTWRKSGDASTDQSNFVIRAGTAIIIAKKAAVSGANSFLAIPMPYSL